MRKHERAENEMFYLNKKNLNKMEIIFLKKSFPIWKVAKDFRLNAYYKYFTFLEQISVFLPAVHVKVGILSL